MMKKVLSRFNFHSSLVENRILSKNSVESEWHNQREAEEERIQFSLK